MPLAEDVAQLLFNGARFFFLLGAGASYSANIPLDCPTEEGLAWRLALSHLGIGAARETYGGPNLQLSNLFPQMTKAVFRDLLRKQNWLILIPTICHDVLARLVAEGYQAEIGTVNYDPLAEEAFRRLKEPISVVAAPNNLELLRDGKRAVLKIHGCPYSDNAPDNLIVTEDELAQGRPWIQALLRGRLQERHCLYVGFSGNVQYVLDSVAATISALGEPLIDSYAVDRIPIEDVFRVLPSSPLARFVEALGIPQAHYSDLTADPFFRALGNQLAKLCLRHALQEAKEGGVAHIVNGAEQICIDLGAVIDRIEYPYAYNWVSRLCGLPDGFRGLRQETDLLISAFRVIILLIGADIIGVPAVAPVLAFPFRQVNPGRPVVIFGGNGNMHIDQLVDEISEQFKQEGFRRAIGCENSDTIAAVAVRCLGVPTAQSAEIISDEPESLRAADRSPFVWIPEQRLFNDFENLAPLFRS